MKNISHLTKTSIICIALIVLNCQSIFGQDISVLQFSGESFAYNSDQDKVKYKKIVFGPLPDANKILVKENASLKLLNDKNEICELTDEGEYMVSALKFKTVQSSSTFDRFCDYFHSFFINHSSSESKSNYKNSIHAISRGRLSPPQLDFPLSGLLPSESGNLSFEWSHACESCQYVVSVNEVETRTNVYAWTTTERSVELENAEKFLLPNKKYYWTVTVSGQEMEYPITRFTMANKKAYSNEIQAMKAEIKKTALGLNRTTESIYIMSQLEEKDLLNYAVFYGKRQISADSKNGILRDYVERFWYDALLE